MASVKTKEMTLNEIHNQGIEVLARELGPVKMIRFLQQYETGKGNYTEERHSWLDDSKTKVKLKKFLHKAS